MSYSITGYDCACGSCPSCVAIDFKVRADRMVKIQLERLKIIEQLNAENSALRRRLAQAELLIKLPFQTQDFMDSFQKYVDQYNIDPQLK